MKKARKHCIAVLFMAALAGANLICVAGELMISEIAWAGTAASSSDEWIEVQNVSGNAIELAGWSLSFGDTTIQLGTVDEDTIEARTATLDAGEYLILERTNDDTISGIDADVLYKGSLPNAGVEVDLRDPSGAVVDSVSPIESGWPAGNSSSGEPPYATMERTRSGDWVTNNGIIRNGLDADGNPLNGTPGQPNSADVLAEREPAVTLLQPIVAGVVLAGVVSVEWSATDPDGADSALSIAILVSSDDGDTWTTLVENLVNGGSFSWNTAQLEAGSTYKVKVLAQDPDGYVGDATSPDLTVGHGSG